MISTPVNVRKFFEKALSDLDLKEDRAELLNALSGVIRDELSSGKKVRLNFICTHNSRRSQFGQVWAYFASHYTDLNNIKAYSGGTQATAFYKNTVRALQNTGFHFRLKEFSHRNPVYEISFDSGIKPLMGFSKRYDDPVNKTPFIAITTCDSAHESCPFIPEALHRVHLPYEDPKHKDGTEFQESAYHQTSKIIAGEMHYLFRKIKNSL